MRRRELYDISTQKSNKSIYIHVAEVFATNVALDEDLSVDIYEYQSIFNAAL